MKFEAFFYLNFSYVNIIFKIKYTDPWILGLKSENLYLLKLPSLGNSL